MYRIYTRTGDKGTTALFGGSRIDKDDIRVEAYGTVDELISQLGVCYASTRQAGLRRDLHAIQKMLFVLGAELASDEKGLARLQQRIGEEDTQALEQLIDRNMAQSGPLKEFVIPGKNLASAQLHVARTLTRRLERVLIAMSRSLTLRDEPGVISTDCQTRCSRWRELKKLVQMLALKLAGINVVLLHLAPQGSATDIQQLRHLLHAPAGDAGSMDNRLFFDSGKRQTSRQQ